MKELSLHILDIVENSVRAGASNVWIEIQENERLVILIKDDGRGMSEETLKHLFDPFFTTRQERRTGLGLSLYREAARRANGDVIVCSALGAGTTVRADFETNHIDRAPLGDVAGTLVTLMALYPGVDFFFVYRRGGDEFLFSTPEMRTALDGVPINHPMALELVRTTFEEWVRERKT